MSVEFPFKIMATSESKLSEFVVENKNHIFSRVNKHGAVLLRGWTADATEFSKVANALGEFIHDMSCSAGPRVEVVPGVHTCLLYTSPSPRDRQKSRMPSSA